MEASHPKEDLAKSRRVQFSGRERRDRPASPSNQSQFSDRRFDDDERYRRHIRRQHLFTGVMKNDRLSGHTLNQRTLTTEMSDVKRTGDSQVVVNVNN